MQAYRDENVGYIVSQSAWYQRVPIENSADHLRYFHWEQDWQIPAIFHLPLSQSGIVRVTEMFEQILKGLRWKQAFGIIKESYRVNYGHILRHAIRSNVSEVFRYLWCSPLYAQVWSCEDLLQLVDLLISCKDCHWFNEYALLNTLLNESEIAKALFCQLPTTMDRLTLVKRIHREFSIHS